MQEKMFKCVICGEDAKYKVKDTTNYYCEECAIEYFGDITLLVKLEPDVVKIKEIIEKKIA